MTNKKIIIITIFLTLIHFILTSFIDHYISAQIGVQMGQIVAGGLMETSDNGRDRAQEEAATTIYQNMKKQSADMSESWKIPQLLISLPARPLIATLLKDIRKQQMSKVIAKEMTPEQFRTQGFVIDNMVNLLNSLLLGLLIYVGLSFLYRKRMVR